MRYLSLLSATGLRGVPKIVVELGPGSSLGTGFCALIAGAERYYALDLVDYTNTAANLAVFDDLVALFREKRRIPSSSVHSLRFPDLDCYDFPESLGIGVDAAFERRVVAIREDIACKGGQFVRTVSPWTEELDIEPASVDWVVAHSVFQHIDDVPSVYRAIRSWLKPTGYLSFLVDFGCHGLTRQWNGHWAVSDRWWSALRGRRPYMINRLPYAEYARIADGVGFRTLLEKRNKCFDGLIPEQFAPRFRSICDEDARTRMAVVVSRPA